MIAAAVEIDQGMFHAPALVLLMSWLLPLDTELGETRLRDGLAHIETDW
jgi:hypothetical protein